MKIAKSVAMLLAFTMAASFLASCSKKEVTLSEEITVKEDDPWYDSFRYDVRMSEGDPSFRKREVGTDYAGGRLFYAYTVTDPNEYWLDQTYINVYGSEGFEKAIEVDYPGDEDPEKYFLRTKGIMIDDDGKTAVAVVEGLNPSGYDFKSYFSNIDLETGKGSELKAIDDFSSSNFVVNNTITVDRYTIIECSPINSSDGFSYFIYEGDSLISSFCVDEIVDNAGYAGIENIYKVPDSELIGLMGYCDNGNFTAKLDPVEGKFYDIEILSFDELRQKAKDSDGKADIADFSFTLQGEYMNADIIGNISRYNKETGQSEVVIGCNMYSPFFSDYSSVIASGLSYDSISVLSHTDEETVLMFEAGFGTVIPNGNKETLVTVLKKADKNPHAGKKVIEIDRPQHCSDYLSAAIWDFNRNDDEYLIRVWDQNPVLTGETVGYAPNGFYLGTADTESRYENRLISQLDTPDVPDIILGLQNERAYSDDRLVELSDYLDKDTREKLFMNILDASRYGKKSYFLPLVIGINGIICLSEDVGEGKRGFTFEEYEKFVQGPCNGIEPYVSDYIDPSVFSYMGFENAQDMQRMDFFTSCIDFGSCVDGDKVDFDNKQFRAAAEYAKDKYITTYYKDPFMEDQDIDDPNINLTSQKPAGKYMMITRFADYANGCDKSSQPYTIMGAPSVDGRGAGFSIYESISVTSACEVKDGVKTFINYLYGGEFKEDFGPLGALCVNREVLEYEFPLLVEYENDCFSAMSAEGMGYSWIRELGVNYCDESMADRLIQDIANLAFYNDPNGDMDIVLHEEMPAYFSGDKSLDEVIKICNDRASTIKSENEL